MSEIDLPTFADVLTAAGRLKGHALRTPLLHSPALDELAGCELHLKAECLQHVGAFKYRGARNRLAALSEQEARAGVVAFSSGNHAQGVARAAKELGIDAIIVMPTDAPAVKVAGVTADGATIITYDRLTESREDIAAHIARRDGRTLVPSYDDPFIIAGQGTVGLEIAESDTPFDAVITCIGGGGLCAGIALSIEAKSPSTHLYGAEPTYYNDHQLSLSSGQRERLTQTPPTLCDAVMTPQPGALTWPINKRCLKGVMTVTDAEALVAMRLAHEHLELRVEPGGAVALAVALRGDLSDYDRVCAVVSGGNVDDAIFAKALAQ